MKKKISKILGVGLVVALLASLIVVAAPVSATVSQPKVTLGDNSISTRSQYIIKFDTIFGLEDDGSVVFSYEGDGSAGWSSAQVKSGSFSVKLDAGSTPLTSRGRVMYYFPTPVLLSTLTSNPTFSAYGVIEDGSPPWNQGPYLNIYLDTNGSGLYDCGLEGVIATATVGYTSGWDVMESATYYESGNNFGCSTLVDELHTQSLADWQAVATDAKVVAVGIILGNSTHTEADQVVYIDNVTVPGPIGPTNEPDSVFVEFPYNTTVPSSYTASSILVSNDGGTTYTPANTVGMNATTRVATIMVPGDEGTTAAAHMAVKFLAGGVAEPASGIVNPSTPGDYTLRVKTSQETTWVESKTYTVGIPGMVTRYNKDGNYVGSYASIQSALTSAAKYDHIILGPGTYTAPITDFPVTYITIESTGEAAETIIKAAVAINEANATFDDVTIKGTVTVTGTDCTIKNCAFTKKSSLSGATLLTNNADNLSITDCTFDTTYGSVKDWAVKIAGGDSTTFDGCTFTTDAGTVTTQDIAIEVTGAVESLLVKYCTFNGTKGTGYYDHAGAITKATVRNSTFDGFEKAFDILNATSNATSKTKLTIRGNTIINSTKKTVGAIDIDGTTGVVIVGNTIADNAGYSVHIEANPGNVTVIGNNFLGNTYGFKNVNSITPQFSAINNWWGDVSGPTISTNVAGTGDKVSTYVTYDPWLTSEATTGTSVAGAVTGLNAKTICGVKVENLVGAASNTLIWVSKYTANPKEVEPKYDALPDAFFDVYISGDGTSATLKFYADGIDKNTDAYSWSGLENKWVKCTTQGASASGGFVWVTVSPTTTPTFSDLLELPFVLVAAPAAAPPTFTLTSPKAGATDMPTKNVPFTWERVAEADSYVLILSANADLSRPMAEATCAGTAYTYAKDLPAGVPFYWQVIARKGVDIEARSDISTFICKEPVVAVAPEIEVTVEAAPPAEITIEAPPAPEVTVNIPPAEVPPIVAQAPVYIWVIIGVGALLMVFVVILIVRTRRVV